MKQLCILICMLFCTTNLVAQERELLPVDWSQIRKEVEDHPQKVKELVMKLSAVDLDTTLTWQDRILAFYGQSFLTNDEEDALRSKMIQQENQGRFEACVATARKMLDVNPLNLDALITAVNALLTMAEDSANQDSTLTEEAKTYGLRAMRIFNTIAMTGDGSHDAPFYVTKVSDEYCFMRHYLDLWKYKGQAATACCDIITLDESSSYYDQPTIHFEITRVYELERMMFEGKKKEKKR